MNALILVTVLLAVGQVAPPPFPRTGPQVAIERREAVRGLELPTARIFVAARSREGTEVAFRYRELKGKRRNEFLAIFEQTGTYYRTESALSCIGDEYRVALVWRGGKYAESGFCPSCQTVISAQGSTARFDVSLSGQGARKLARLFGAVTGQRRYRCAG